MEDDWEEDVAPQASSFSDEGKSYGKGRGFIGSHEDNSRETNGYSDGGGRGHGRGRGSFGGGRGSRGGYNNRRDNDNDDDNSGWGSKRNDDNGGYGSRGGGRGGYNKRNDNNYGGGLGYGGGYKNNDDNDGEYRPRGGGRGGGRGGFNRRNNDDDDDNGGGGGGGYGGYRNNDNSSDGYKPRGGGRGGFNRRNNDDDSGGYSSKNNYNNDDNGGGYGGRGRGRGGGRGGFNRNNDREDSNDQSKDENEKPREIYIPPEPSNEDSEIFGEGVSTGINFDKYKHIEVKVSGENVPEPIKAFDTADLRPILVDNIRKSSYNEPTPVQKYAIPIIMSGRDLMACAQTGSGKTAAFLVPIISNLLNAPVDLVTSHCAPQVVIVSPTRELAIQIWKETRKFARTSVITSTVVYGGTSTMHQANKVQGGCHILVATPGRLMDFVGRGRITFDSVRFLVLDEADRMLEKGFLQDLEKMFDHETMVQTGERQTLMFSATFPEEVQRLAGRFLIQDYLFLTVGILGGACTDVEQNFYEVTKSQKKNKLKELLERESSKPNNRIMIFVEMKRTADFIAAFLSENSYPSTSIHGDRLQSQRETALWDFRTGKMPILVATDVAARGLDIKDVAHVINYDMPKGIDDYVHRIGRTGRVGNIGKATSFFDVEKDSALVKDLVRILRQANQSVPDWLDNSEDKSYVPGRSAFGGRDVRKFGNESGGGDYQYSTVESAEPEEEW